MRYMPSQIIAELQNLSKVSGTRNGCSTCPYVDASWMLLCVNKHFVSLCGFVSKWMQEIPDHLKMQGMCAEAVRKVFSLLAFIPDCLKTHEMYEKPVKLNRWTLRFVSDPLKTQEKCKGAVKKCPWSLVYVSDKYQTWEMCSKPVLQTR